MTTHTFGTAINPAHFAELTVVTITDDVSDPVNVSPRPDVGTALKVRDAATLADLTDITLLTSGYWTYSTTDIPAIYVSGDNWDTSIGPLYSREAQAAAIAAYDVATSAASTAATASSTATAASLAAVAAQSTADNALATAEAALAGGGGGGGGASGVGANWVAASNAPAALKTAIAAAGGAVCTGTNDHTAILAKLAAYKSVQLTEGSFYIGGTILMPQGRCLSGVGIRATELIGASGLFGQFISITSDQCEVHHMTITAGGEAAGTHGIHVNVTNQTGFTTGADSVYWLSYLVGRLIKGDGIFVEGSNAREGKLQMIHMWNCVGRGYYLNAADGNGSQLIAGTCGPVGFELGTSAGNWHLVNCKSWYNDGDGFLIQGVRHTLDTLEAQDNQEAGIRILGNIISANGITADSNSYDNSGATDLTNVHSGIVIGRTRTGTSSGGYDIQGTGWQSWDKNEGGRGYKQRSGIRVRSGARGVCVIGFTTGDPAGTHHNVTAGIEFDSPADQTHSSNVFIGVSHHVAMLPPAGSTAATSYLVSKQLTPDEVLRTGTTLTDDPTLNITVPGANGASILRYKVSGIIVYRADATTKTKIALALAIASGSGSVGGHVQWRYVDSSGVDQIDTKSLATVNAITGQGSSADTSTDASNTTVWIASFTGHIYASTSVVTMTAKIQNAEATTTGTGSKILDGSYLQLDVLA
jgi:hypothetical protein